MQKSRTYTAAENLGNVYDTTRTRGGGGGGDRRANKHCIEKRFDVNNTANATTFLFSLSP